MDTNFSRSLGQVPMAGMAHSLFVHSFWDEVYKQEFGDLLGKGMQAQRQFE